MRKIFLLSLATLAAATCSLWAEPPKAPELVQVAAGEEYVLTIAYTPEKKLTWIAGWVDEKDVFVFRGYEPNPGTATFQIKPKKDGKFKIIWRESGDDLYSTTIIDTGKEPAPPGPAPTPNPPGPTPTPAPSATPFPGVSGLHVLVVLETADLTKYPPGQISALRGANVRNYLNSKTVKLADGTNAWRIWDPDVPRLELAPVPFQQALKVGKAKNPKMPWIAVGDGKTGEITDLPADEGKILELLKKYGG